MITFENLSRKPGTFKDFTRVSVAEYEGLLEQVTSLWVERDRTRLARPHRQRAVGGGRKPAPALREPLLLTLVWLRLYLTTEALGYLFGIDKATESRYIWRMLHILQAIGKVTLGWSEPPKRGKSLEEVREEHPDPFAFVDATRQQEGVRKTRSPRSNIWAKKEAVHAQGAVIVNEEGLVRNVSESVPGSVHDRRLFTQSGAASKSPKGVVGGDAGYRKIQDNLPEHSVITPFEKLKRQPLKEVQNQINQAFARARIVVENTIGAFRHFKALAEVFRQAVALWDEVVRAVLAIAIRVFRSAFTQQAWLDEEAWGRGNSAFTIVLQ